MATLTREVVLGGVLPSAVVALAVVTPHEIRHAQLTHRQARWFSSGWCGWFPGCVGVVGVLSRFAELFGDEGPGGVVAAERHDVVVFGLFE